MEAKFEGDQQVDDIFQSVLGDFEAKENDLALAAELGQTLLAANEILRRENNEMLENFRQKIYELENERNILKMRLDTVEHDYDTQIKELQTDIVSMRLDVQKQRKMYKQLESEKASIVNELTEQNQTLSKRLQDSSENEARLEEELKAIRTQCAQRKTSIQDHFHTLDSLRVEITALREEKVKLESKLAAVTEERDNLVESLADSYRHISAMEQLQSEHIATINSQDVAIASLQARANTLQEDLKSLTSRQDKRKGESSSTSRNAEGRPHHSLLAELAEQRLELLNSVHFDFPDGGLPGDDDDDVEMDDEALLAYLRACATEVNVQLDETAKPSAEPLTQSKGALVGELRAELGEIYQQMRQMCVEVQALNGAQTIANRDTLLNGGTHTPDELAIVEMDFRLSSLKSVLGDLRGLLRELVMEDNPELSSDTDLCKQKSIDNPECAVYSDEHKAMLEERNTLAHEVATAQRQLSAMRNRHGNDENANAASCSKLGGSKFVANWQELDDDDYEFELPQ